MRVLSPKNAIYKQRVQHHETARALLDAAGFKPQATQQGNSGTRQPSSVIDCLVLSYRMCDVSCRGSRGGRLGARAQQRRCPFHRLAGTSHTPATSAYMTHVHMHTMHMQRIEVTSMLVMMVVVLDTRRLLK